MLFADNDVKRAGPFVRPHIDAASPDGVRLPLPKGRPVTPRHAGLLDTPLPGLHTPPGRQAGLPPVLAPLAASGIDTALAPFLPRGDNWDRKAIPPSSH